MLTGPTIDEVRRSEKQGYDLQEKVMSGATAIDVTLQRVDNKAIPNLPETLRFDYDHDLSGLIGSLCDMKARMAALASIEYQMCWSLTKCTNM